MRGGEIESSRRLTVPGASVNTPFPVCIPRKTTWSIASPSGRGIISLTANQPPIVSSFRMLPPLHLRIFLRDLAINIVYSGDGDLAQGLFEDYILHKDEKEPPLKRGHYSRTLQQMEECVRYIDFCTARQPGSFEQHDSLLHLARDSSRLIYTLVKIVDGEDNRSPSEEMLQAFLADRINERDSHPPT